MSDLEVVNSLETALAKKDYSSLRNFLKLAREYRLRDPEHVATLGAELLTKHARKLPQDELWTLHEQVCVAALDCGHSDLAYSLIKNVNRKFPDSARAARLTALFVEFSGDLPKAEELYKKELEISPQNPMILKRMVALHRGHGDLHAAIEALRAYLDVQQADWVAWEELADLYLQTQAYQQAAFCLEEVLLHQPTSLATHLLLADTLYTLGGAASWRSARSYYSGVVEMTEGRNLRALYGVCACAAQLAGIKSRESREDDDAGLPKLAAEALLQRYAEDAPGKLPLVRAMLKAQGLQP